MKSVLVEGGAGIILSVLEQGLAHQLILCIRPCFFGGYRSMTQQLHEPVGMTNINIASVDGDVVLYGQLESNLKYISNKQLDKNAGSNSDASCKSANYSNGNNTSIMNSENNSTNNEHTATNISMNLNHYSKRRLVQFINADE